MSSPNPPNSPERQFVQKIAQALVRWSPLGGSIGILASFLLRQDWLLAIVTFPVTVVTVFWAAYTKGFLERLEEVASDRGRQDVDQWGLWIGQWQRALTWQLANFEGKYRQAQADACVYDEVEGYSRPDKIKTATLEEIFVPLEFSGDFSRDREGNPISLQLGSGSRDLEALWKKQQEQGSLKIWDFLATVRQDARSRSLAIRAWGGYGKTTLTRHLTYLYARRPQVVRRRKSPKLIPVLLPLREWRDLLAQPEAPSLPDLITQHHIPKLFPTEFPEGTDPQPRLEKLMPPNWAAYQLQRGRMLVLLDGFDEVEDFQRKAVSQWISRQLARYSKSVFILTSRPGGYKDYKRYATELPKTALMIQPFKPEQWQAFIHKWYLCQEQQSRSQRDRHQQAVASIAARNANNLIRQIQQRHDQGRSELADMARNPLLLNMLATFHRFYQGADLPQRRVALYRDVCKLQLEDRPRARNIPLPLDGLEPRLQILQRLAWYMVQQNCTGLKQSELEHWLAQQLPDFDPQVEAASFLKQIADVSELLVERETGQFEFAHLSFQGYLAATQVKQQRQENLLLNYLSQCQWQADEKAPWWQETLRLYVAQVPTNLLSKACEIKTDASINLAHDWLKEIPKLDPNLEAELAKLRQQVQHLWFHDLETYLSQGQWQQADNETYELMIRAVGKEPGDYFTQDELLNFPADELLTIDRLWRQYSNDRFGFSIQKEIYRQCGGNLDGSDPSTKTWHQFCTQVGWRVNDSYISYREVTFNTSAPSGHLPVWVVGVYGLCAGGAGARLFWLAGLFSRIETCKS